MIDVSTIFSAPFKDIDIYALVGEAVEKNDEVVKDVMFQQLDKGLDSKGKSLGKYKNFKYKNRFQPVDLKREGNWRAKETVSTSRNKKSAEMFSQDFKDKFLTKRYGKDIHGVATPYFPTVEAAIKPDLQDSFKNAVLKNT